MPLGSLAMADADAEREALARLTHEIEALEPLIRSATDRDGGIHLGRLIRSVIELRGARDGERAGIESA